MTADDWIKELQLKKHPEGGYFRETYRSDESIPQNALPSRYKGGRDFSTAIYFLLKSDQASALHRIQSDELWFFHDGSPIEITVKSPGGNDQKIMLGKDILSGECLQAVMPKQYWFSARVLKPDSYTLVSCTVSPGFDFADFELKGPIQ